ncbi:TPA: winged helix-turn-helix domain-containing protein [Stenotrophomonas maltophilia]|nr:winged helix-turn-helix domain-containing protein [Stenotrophomonas maltophilia]
MNHPARYTDPSSSHEAAAHMVSSGAQAVQQSQASSAVRKYPGLTSLELARATGLDRFMLARRLPEIEKQGLIRRGMVRKCSASNGRSGCTWFPNSPAEGPKAA